MSNAETITLTVEQAVKHIKMFRVAAKGKWGHAITFDGRTPIVMTDNAQFKMAINDFDTKIVIDRSTEVSWITGHKPRKTKKGVELDPRAWSKISALATVEASFVEFVDLLRAQLEPMMAIHCNLPHLAIVPPAVMTGYGPQCKMGIRFEHTKGDKTFQMPETTVIDSQGVTAHDPIAALNPNDDGNPTGTIALRFDHVILAFGEYHMKPMLVGAQVERASADELPTYTPPPFTFHATSDDMLAAMTPTARKTMEVGAD